MVARLCPFLALVAATATAAPAGPPDAGFRLEPKAEVDDVFGDTTDYRRIVDHFLSLNDTMQRTHDEFARAVQSMLADLRPLPGAKEKARRCNEATAAPTYARALTLGEDYLRAGRELTRFYEQIREYDRLGETVGLTPDYRWKVKKVVAQYGALLTDYREMKVAFHEQLAEELRYAGCSSDRLAARAGATPIKEEAWATLTDGAGAAAGAPDNATLPAQPDTAHPAKPARGETPLDTTPVPRAGILFYIDNTRCSTGTHVTLDGHAIGDVPGATRAAFSTTPGPHDLCLIPDGGKKCGEPGTIRKSYLHEGWTIALRCD